MPVESSLHVILTPALLPPLSLTRTLLIARGHPDNPESSPHLRIFNLLTSLKLFLPNKGTSKTSKDVDVCKCRADWCKAGSMNVLESGLTDLLYWVDGIGIGEVKSLPYLKSVINTRNLRPTAGRNISLESTMRSWTKLCSPAGLITLKGRCCSWFGISDSLGRERCVSAIRRTDLVRGKSEVSQQ